jgi:DNA-directed RNA polymerase subunit omega
MIYPEISNLMEKADSRYSLVIAVATRARDLVDGSVPLVKTGTGKQVTIAVNEMAEGKIRLKYPPAKKQAKGEETTDVQQ